MNDTVILIMFIFIAVMLLWMGFIHIYFLVDYIKDKIIAKSPEEKKLNSQIKRSGEMFELWQTLEELKCYSRGECLYGDEYRLGANQWFEIEKQLLDGKIDITDVPQKIRVVNLDVYSIAFRYACIYALNNKNDYLKYQNICDTMMGDIKEIDCLHCKSHLIKYYLDSCYYDPYIEYLDTK